MIRRGSVWWVGFEPAVGAAGSKLRPALVVSAEEFNRSRLATVVVAVLTSNTERAAAAGNVLLEPGAVGLDRPSVVNVTQIFAVDRAWLVEHIGDLDGPQMWLVSEGLRRSLAL